MRRRRDLAAGRQSSAFSLLFQGMWATCRAARSVAANRRKTGRGHSRNTSGPVRERRDARVLAAAICRPIVFTLPGRYIGRGHRARTRRPKGLRENLKTFGGACRPDPHRLDDLRRGDRPQQRSGAVRWLHQLGVLSEYAWRSADDRCSASVFQSGRPVASNGFSVGIGR